MGTGMSFRHNIMMIHSPEEFINIKGGYINGVRDVYFMRALGETKDFGASIREIDEKLARGRAQNRLIYTRVEKLPVLFDTKDVEKYTKVYNAWKEKKVLPMSAACPNPKFDTVLREAASDALELYRIVKGNMTESIEKNFLVKLFFWTDEVLKEILPLWNEKRLIKVIAADCTKVQDYLFYYMLTRTGCDVLLLNHKKDLSAAPKILALSGVMTLGSFGHSIVPKPEPVKKSGETVQPKVKPKLQAKTQTAGPVVRGVEKAAKELPKEKVSERAEAVPREKSPEELAKLASRVVMITVLDGAGKAVGTGSGIMVQRKGLILTNYHVIRNGRTYAVRVEEEEQIYRTDEVIKYNDTLDLALLRIPRMLDPIEVYDGREKLVRGQKVVAIGSPLGLFNSVSDGIISGFRKIGGKDMIQFTAPISAGSPGGAVLNMYGEIIGISTAGIDQGQNLNLAVSFEDIRLFGSGLF